MGPQIQHVNDSDRSGFRNFPDFGFQLKMINEDRAGLVNCLPSSNKMLKFKVRKDIVKTYSFKYFINLSFEIMLNSIFIFEFQISPLRSQCVVTAS